MLRSEVEALGTAAPVDAVLSLYGRHRLLTFDRDPATREPTVEVAHEALLREWGRLRDWLEGSRADVRQQRLLGLAAGEWVAAQRDPSFLLRGTRLAQFEGWAEGSAVALTGQERDYLEASVAARQRREAEEAARLQRELQQARKLAAEAEARAAAEAEALANLNRSEAQRLAVESSQLLLKGMDPQLAALLALRSLQYEYTPQGDEALEVAARRIYPLATFTIPGKVAYGALVYSPDGHTLLTANSNGLFQLRDAATWQVLHEFSGPADVVIRPAFSPDGQIIATAGMNNPIQLWDAATGQELGQLGDPVVGAYDIAFSPDGRYLLCGGSDHIARLWDVSTLLNTGVESRQELRQFVGHTDQICAVAFSPDGRFVVSGSLDGSVRLWYVDINDAIAELCGQLLRDLTEVERAQFGVSGEEPVCP